MNFAVRDYQRRFNTREIPYCSYPAHEHRVKSVKELEECMRKGCNYLQSLYPEEIRVLVKHRR